MALLEEAIRLINNYRQFQDDTVKLLKNFKGTWNPTSFGFALCAPENAKLAILSYTPDVRGLQPVCRVLSHQIYLEKVIKLIEEKDARLVAVDFVGHNISESESTLIVWSKDGN